MAEGCWWTAANKKAHTACKKLRAGEDCLAALNHVTRLLAISRRDGCFVCIDRLNPPGATGNGMKISICSARATTDLGSAKTRASMLIERCSRLWIAPQPDSACHGFLLGKLILSMFLGRLLVATGAVPPAMPWG